MEDPITAYINADDIGGSIRGFSSLELKLEECSLLDFDAHNPAQFFYTTFLACYLLKGDLDSAKYLWKRAPQPWKSSSSGTFLAEMWEVGKALWNGDTSVALINLSIQWPSELHFMVEKLKAAVELNVLKTVQLSYNCISIENLAQRLNISPAGLILRLDQLGWVVDQSAGVVRPVQSAPDDRVFRFQKELNENHCLLQKVSGFAAHLGKDSAKVEK